MLNNTRLKVYATAYTTRLKKGQKMEEIDDLYLKKKRLTDEDVQQVHQFLKENNI